MNERDQLQRQLRRRARIFAAVAALTMGLMVYTLVTTTTQQTDVQRLSLSNCRGLNELRAKLTGILQRSEAFSLANPQAGITRHDILIYYQRSIADLTPTPCG